MLVLQLLTMRQQFHYLSNNLMYHRWEYGTNVHHHRGRHNYNIKEKMVICINSVRNNPEGKNILEE